MILEQTITKPPKARVKKTTNTDKGNRGKVFPHEKEYQGLCSTCLHASACTFPKNPNRPVLECEEFEVIQAPQRGVTHAVTSLPEHAQENQYHGLCVNCENRKTCIYAKAEGGVWHCEEYM